MSVYYPARSIRDDVGDESDPQAIRRTRRNTLDYLTTLGQPVIFKHKWTEDDVKAGLAEYCPYCRNVEYRQPSESDPACFGTGYLGGFDDGVLIWMSFGDSSVDSFKLTREGILVKNNDPICNAPWDPPIEDGDLLIQCELDDDYWTITSLGDRYIAAEVTPVTPRGASRATSQKLYLVAQQFQVEQIQPSHPYANVPVIFDKTGLPAVPSVPPGGDPDDYGVGSTTSFDLVGYMPVAVPSGGVTVNFE